ncbi:MAG: hypothetical protein IPL49_07015 [Saprospirales bacterium]|nr:hypothetical protein [Saprospirales bacterium]MBK8490641.1 hypothetical protein [Saprospirales bacterium]
MRVILLSLFLITLSACGEETPLTLSWEEKSLVDSLYKEEIARIRPELDSLCDSRFDSLITFYTDSLWTDRIQEINRQLERIKLQ